MEKQVKILISAEGDDWGHEAREKLLSQGAEMELVKRDGLVLLEKIRAVRPQIIFMEMFMPGLDAIGVLNSLKANTHYSPMVVVTATYATDTLEREVLSCGATYFAVSPYSKVELLDRIMHLYFSKGLSDPQASKPPSLRVRVTDILHQLGVPAHIKGFQYLRDSIILSVENPEIMNAITKQLYPSVAKEYNTTSSRVERAIRHAIEVAWDRCDVDILNAYFGYTIHNARGKPTNSEFVAMISDNLSLERNKQSASVKR